MCSASQPGDLQGIVCDYSPPSTAVGSLLPPLAERGLLASRGGLRGISRGGTGKDRADTSKRLLQGLRQFENDVWARAATASTGGSASSRAPPTPADPSLSSSAASPRDIALSDRARSRGAAISLFGKRANERASEALEDCLEHSDENPKRSNRAGSTSTDRRRPRDDCEMNSVRDFEQLVASIDAAFTGGRGAVRAVRKDEIIKESIVLHGIRHYKVSLPVRPATVIVELKRSSGLAPSLWASTVHERPGPKNAEMRGKDARIVYEHAFGADDTDEIAAQVDRRCAVPKCKDLFVTVSADMGECTFTLAVTIAPIKIKLTRAELAVQVQKIRSGWESRVFAIQHEPAQRELFDERLKKIESEMSVRKHELYGQNNFMAKNAKAVQDALPIARFHNRKRAAVDRLSHHEETLRRREETERKTEEHRKDWLEKAEERKRHRELEEKLIHVAREKASMYQSWFTRLLVFSFAERVQRDMRDKKDVREFLKHQALCTGLVNRFILRSTVWKRRRSLYHNVCTFRAALATYCRVVRPAVRSNAQPIVCLFLSQYAFHREVPNIRGTLGKFRAKIVLVQHWWRMKLIIRSAYRELLTPFWEKAQLKVCMEEAATESAKVEALNSKAGVGIKGPNVLDAREVMKPASQPTTIKKEKSRRGSKMTFDPWSICPIYIAHLLMNDYIAQMQRTHKLRVKAWEDQKVKTAFTEDLDAFTGGDAVRTVKGKPRSVYIDPHEMEAIVRQTVENWRQGVFRHLYWNRVRIMRGPLHLWANSCGVKVQPDIARDGTGLASSRIKLKKAQLPRRNPHESEKGKTSSLFAEPTASLMPTNLLGASCGLVGDCAIIAEQELGDRLVIAEQELEPRRVSLIG